MHLNKILASSLCFILSFGVINLGFMKQAQAKMISTSVVVEQLSHQQNMEKVEGFLKRTDVKDQMVKMGVDPKEASLRLASLSDSEVREMAFQIENNVAGADVIVIGLGTILLIIIIILLLQRV